LSRIVVTGIGVISSLGNSAEESHDALVKGSSGLSTGDLFKTKYAGAFPFGEIKTDTQQLKEKLKATESGVTRTTLLALHAFNEAIADGKLNISDLSSRSTALVVANTVGGMCMTDELYSDCIAQDNGTPYIDSYDGAAAAMYLQQRFAVKGIINSINTACSSSANAIMYGARLIKNGFAKRAIVGGTDSLGKFTINGFNALNILSSNKCRPFDKEREGLNLGEGAAFLILEREEDAVHKNKYAILSGYANTNDAFHPSALSENGEGPYLAMTKALQVAKMNAAQIDFINAHGTGTQNNDESESKAMMRVFNSMPPFISTKSKTGHTLGAAAAVESVFSMIALKHDEIYPSLNFSSPIESTGLMPVVKMEKQRLQNVMVNSFGFGGNCSSLIFSKN